MSFFKFKSSSTTTTNIAQPKRDLSAPQLNPLGRNLSDASAPVRPDGSDKFFGFENYGSTCYCNSIIQCLYYSAPFRENVINFPSTAFIERIRNESNGTPLLPQSPTTVLKPRSTSPARKATVPASPLPAGLKLEDQNESPEFRKRMAKIVGPVLEITSDNSNQYGMDESLFTSLRDIFEAIIGQQSRVGVVSPHRFLEVLRRENEMFRSAMHQDAHEFLNLLLNQVVDNVDLFAKQHPSLVAAHADKEPSESSSATDLRASTDDDHTPKGGLDAHWVHDIFEGLLTSETRCLTCENTSQRDEAFLDLSVDLSPHTSVTSCLRKFSEEEMLCERNKFHCDNCGGLQEAEKRMKIKRLPRILALHLKRFKYTEDLQRLQKLFHRVAYPFHLRLFNTTDDAEDPDRLYELYAVVVHIGGGPYHGHYVSIIKTENRGWLLFDDELVEPVDKSYVMNFFGGEPVPGAQEVKQLACAYVLFYQETTLEAVLKEEEMEVGGMSAHSRVSNETATSPIKNGNGTYQPFSASVQSPRSDEFDNLQSLAPADIMPNLPSFSESAHRSFTTEHVHKAQTSTLTAKKSRRELKQEGKERKAARKAEEKAAEGHRKAEERAAEERTAEERAAEEKRKADEKADDEGCMVHEKAADDRRIANEGSDDEKRQEMDAEQTEAGRKSGEMRLAPETSKEAAAEEAKGRSDVPHKEGGLSRFRNASMSLRKRPNLFSRDRDKEKHKEARNSDDKVPPIPQWGGHARPQSAPKLSDDPVHMAESNPMLLLPPPPQQSPCNEATHLEDKRKRGRFSLGKKRSGHLV